RAARMLRRFSDGKFSWCSSRAALEQAACRRGSASRRGLRGDARQSRWQGRQPGFALSCRRGGTMESEQFVAELEAENRAQLAALAEKSSAGDAPGALTVAALLKLALRNEYEAADLAACWMADTDELDAKLALARQCGDEAKHYRWIEDRLKSLGVDLGG